MLKATRRLILSGLFLLVAAWGLVFAIVLGAVPSYLWLSIVGYIGSAAGLFLGLLGAASYVGERRRRD